MTISAIINLICSERPHPNRELDQVLMKPNSIKKQLSNLERYIKDKDVIILGDDDFLGVFISMYLRSKSITIFEVDRRIIRKINELSIKYNLDISTVEYDVVNEPKGEYIGRYDFFITNPPFGSKNNGESVCFFIYRCLQMCKRNCSGCFIAPNKEKIPWSTNNLKNIQKFIIDSGGIFEDINPDIHEYYHENGNLSSSSFIVKFDKALLEAKNFNSISLY